MVSKKSLARQPPQWGPNLIVAAKIVEDPQVQCGRYHTDLANLALEANVTFYLAGRAAEALHFGTITDGSDRSISKEPAAIWRDSSSRCGLVWSLFGCSPPPSAWCERLVGPTTAPPRTAANDGKAMGAVCRPRPSPPPVRKANDSSRRSEPFFGARRSRDPRGCLPRPLE